ncbi:MULTISPECIES: hypothetical protein [unclassified Pseudovibrio]|uniref:hypothetical protein n=1 Tax=unclassified Pseudovibrio TaxID=2627060 RepID=UPI0007AEC6DA|nr:MULTISPECIES: hypothetical protein [unclassified Pseudovibrio]KZL01323.1 hypothetical protein PsW74_02121 [Pseudovibrio sp. W74]KZL08925.1 hypothetical protein PsAD14_02504 [Pseudovibrio sp. Ad14]
MEFAKVALAATLLAATTAAPTLAKNGVERVPTKIDWQAAKIAAKRSLARDPAAVEKFVTATTGKLSYIELPVLIFGSDAKMETPQFGSQNSSYAAFYTLEGAQISILGSHSVLTGTEDLTEHHKATAHESIGNGADYNLNRYGAHYTIRLTCDNPIKDTRCRKPDFLQSVVQTLLVVNGANQ